MNRGYTFRDGPARRFQRGVDAFLAGEIAPSDHDEAEGWYFAENTTSAHERALRLAQTEDRAAVWPLLKWALPRTAMILAFLATWTLLLWALVGDAA